MKDVMFAIMIASLLNFFAGSLMGPQNDTELARGFIGYSRKLKSIIFIEMQLKNVSLFSPVDLFTENWEPAYNITDGQLQNFISVFSVYFPASIGILAGANVSGDLRVSSVLFFLLVPYPLT